MNETCDEITNMRQPVHRLRKCIVCFLLMFGLILIVVYSVQPDRLVAVTMIPPWSWLVLLFAGSVFVRHRIMVFVFAIWLVFIWMHVEEVGSLSRLVTHSNKVGNLRVASLNCNVGSTKAACEALATGCDVILLQESPSLDSLNRAGFKDREGQMEVVWSGDNSIAIRGHVEPVYVDQASHFCHVVATLESGLCVDVVSLRLSAPVFRLDFWSSGFWGDHYRKRIHHREQLRQVVEHLRKHQRSEVLIVGGDFNSVARDGAMVSTLEGLVDSFELAGVGWGGTGTNEFPIFRVDQIWGSKNLASVHCRIIKTEYSDHRMVVADFELERQDRANLK